MEALKVKVGDEVIVSILYWNIRRQTEQTKEVVGKVFRISEKSETIEVWYGSKLAVFDKYGRDSRKTPLMRIPKNGEIKEIEEVQEKEVKVEFLKKYRYEDLPIEVIRELVDVIEKYRRNKED